MNNNYSISDNARPDICFDVDGKAGEKMMLIHDQSNGFKVTGSLFQPNPADDAVYFDQISILSPGGVVLNVDQSGWTVLGMTQSSPSFGWQQNSLKYGDVYIGQSKRINRTYQMTITIAGGVTFRYKLKHFIDFYSLKFRLNLIFLQNRSC